MARRGLGGLVVRRRCRVLAAVICAELVSVNGVQSVSPTASQPADMSSCALVVMVGTDTAALSAFAFPSSVDAGVVWTMGFCLVVMGYVAAYPIGLILSMLDPRR